MDFGIQVGLGEYIESMPLSSHMIKASMVMGIDLDVQSMLSPCATCIQAEATCRPFLKHSMSEQAKSYGDKVVSDIWGPITMNSLGGKRFYNSYLDLAMHKEWVYFLKKKSKTKSMKHGQKLNAMQW